MLKAVIFDFDGVIADSELLHYRTFNGAFEPFGVNIEQDKYYELYLGYSDADGVDAISADYGLELDDKQREQILASKEQLFKEIASEDSFIIDGVSEFISMLRENGVRLGICSGALKNEILMMLEKSDFANAFEVIVSADDVVKGKPDPEPYIKTFQLMNDGGELLAGDCLVVEDSVWGLQAARSAGMNTLAVTNSYSAETLIPYADKVVKSLSELGIEQLRMICEK